MSRENVEIVRAFIDAVNRGDWDAVVDRMAQDFEYDFSRSMGPNRGVYDLGQVRELLDEFFGVWESFRYEADEFIEAGEHLVIPFTTTVRGRDEIEVQAHPTFVYTFRDGEITRLCMYQEREEALQAVGLQE